MTDLIPDGMYPNTHRVSGMVVNVGNIVSKPLGKDRVLHTRALRVSIPYGSDFGTTQKMCIVEVQFLNKHTNDLNPVQEGDTVTVFFSLRGNQHQGRTFTNVVGERVEILEKGVGNDNR